MYRRLGAWVCALVAAAVVASACSGSSSSTPKTTAGAVSGTAQLRAAAAASLRQPGRIDGTFTSLGVQGTVAGSYAGELTKGRGDITLSLRKPAALTAELRWTGGTLYTRSVLFPSGFDPDTNGVAPIARGPGTLPWARQGSQGGLITTQFDAFDPPGLLGQLIDGPGAEIAGHEVIGGVNATHIRVPQAGILFGFWVSPSVDVWLDAHDQPVRVEVSSKGGTLRYDVRSAPAPAVAPPPASQIETGQPRVFQPTGPYTTAASGSANGVSWSLLRAPGPDGYVCWRWGATPSLASVGANGAQGAVCALPPAATADPTDRVQFVYGPTHPAAYDAVAAFVAGGARSATIGFVGGTLRPLPLTNGFVVFAGPPSPAPAYLAVVLADGTKVECGRGAVSVPADLTDSQLTAHASGAPWVCG